MSGTKLDMRNFRVRERGTIPKKEETPAIRDRMNEPGRRGAE